MPIVLSVLAAPIWRHVSGSSYLYRSNYSSTYLPSLDKMQLHHDHVSPWSCREHTHILDTNASGSGTHNMRVGFSQQKDEEGVGGGSGSGVRSSGGLNGWPTRDDGDFEAGDIGVDSTSRRDSRRGMSGTFGQSSGRHSRTHDRSRPTSSTGHLSGRSSTNVGDVVEALHRPAPITQKRPKLRSGENEEVEKFIDFLVVDE